MKARTPTRETHPVPGKSISSQSIPDPQPQAARAKEADHGQPPSLEQSFFHSESTDPAGCKILFLEQNIKKTERPGCSADNKDAQSWTACFMYGILESFSLVCWHEHSPELRIHFNRLKSPSRLEAP